MASLRRSCRRCEVGADQLFLAAEGVVERRLGDPGASDDPVDADHVHALGVEELVGRVEQAVAGGSLVGAAPDARGVAVVASATVAAMT